MRQGIPLYGAGLLLAALGGGCTAIKTVEAPAGWPGVCAQRKLYPTSLARIYASDEPTASQADRAIRAAETEFRRRTGRAPAQGVLLVNDMGIPPIATDRAEILVMVHRATNVLDPSTQPDDSNVIHRVAEAFDSASKQGIDLDAILQAQPMALPCETAQRMGLPVEPPAWVLALPSDELRWRFMQTILDRVTKDGNATLAQKTMLAGMMPLMRSQSAKQAEVDRQTAVFCQFVRADQAASTDQKLALVKAYKETHRAE